MREGVEAGHEGRNGGPPVDGDTDSDLDAALLVEARAHADGEPGEATDALPVPVPDPLARALHESAPHFSAYGSPLSRTQWIAIAVVAALTGLGIVANGALTARVWIGVATLVYVFLILFRFHVVRRGDPRASGFAWAP